MTLEEIQESIMNDNEMMHIMFEAKNENEQENEDEEEAQRTWMVGKMLGMRSKQDPLVIRELRRSQRTQMHEYS